MGVTLEQRRVAKRGVPLEVKPSGGSFGNALSASVMLLQLPK
jgi:hypothetical protein